MFKEKFSFPIFLITLQISQEILHIFSTSSLSFCRVIFKVASFKMSMFISQRRALLGWIHLIWWRMFGPIWKCFQKCNSIRLLYFSHYRLFYKSYRLLSIYIFLWTAEQKLQMYNAVILDFCLPMIPLRSVTIYAS